MRGHLALAGHGIQRFAPEEPKDQLHLPLGAPPLREVLRSTRHRGFLPTGLPSGRLLGHPNLLGSIAIPPFGEALSKEIGCGLGELNSAVEARWRKTVRIFNAQGEAQQLALFPAGAAPGPADTPVAEIRLDRIRWTRPRDFGDVWLSWHLWQRLGLDRFCETALDAVPADVPWSRIAAILAINRLCAPGSELAIEARWYGTTALDDLLGVDGARINTDRLHRCLDLLLPHKDALERHLAMRYGELFGVQYELLLYDLTSTYVEGAAAANPQMRRGYSRDHRPDCVQVVLALVVSPEGFPLAYEVFDRHRTDVTTLDAILEAVEAKYGQAQRVWVLDRGIISERI
jgi:hypothetical protein